MQLLYAEKERGAQYEKGVTQFRVFAPQAKAVSVCLTARGKIQARVPMIKNGAGLWEKALAKVFPGQTYLYLVEDCHGKKMLRSDPVSFSVHYDHKNKQMESVVVDQSAYVWHDHAWLDERARRDPLKQPLAIYEVQLKSWKRGISESSSYKALAHELVAYCKTMHFTHVELYGLLDHHRARERGYQISHYFAPYHQLGSADDVKYLIDQLHSHGIGVIVDWVMAHFHHGHTSKNKSASLHEFDGTDLLGAEKSAWGTLFFDYSKEETRRLMQASALYWIDTMHVDGLRFDAVSHMLSRNGEELPAAKKFLQELNTLIHNFFPGVLLIAEDTHNTPNLTKKVSDGGLGFDLKWGISWCRESREYFHAPSQEQFQKLSHFLKGVQRREKQLLTHSHDDSDSGEYSSEDTLYNFLSGPDRFGKLRNFFSWQTLAPSRGYLIHMGDELGQPESWYQRFQKSLSSVNWNLENVELHQKLQKCVSELNALYSANPPFWENGEMGFEMISEWAPNKIVAYYRANGGRKRFAIIHNFSDVGYPSYDVSLSKDAKTPKRIFERFNSDNVLYGGSGMYVNPEVKIVTSSRSSKPIHYRLAIAPHSTLVLEEEL